MGGKRETLMKFLAGFAAPAALALAACSEDPAPPAPVEPAAEPAPPAAPTQPGLSWDMASSGEGVALVMSGPDGSQRLHLGCTRHPPRLVLVVNDFNPVGSEERLTVGLDEQLFVFVAEPTAPGAGVRATTAVSGDFLERLPRAATLGAVYGAQAFGPVRPPPQEMATRFAAECRQAAGLP